MCEKLIKMQPPQDIAKRNETTISKLPDEEVSLFDTFLSKRKLSRVR